jgi:phenylacetate-CoA ligase
MFSPELKEQIFIGRTKTFFPSIWAKYEEFLAHEKMNRDELDAYNFKKRQEILAYAYNNTEFYRDLYDSVGLKPEDIKTEADWGNVPIVTKQMVREHWEKMMAESIDSPYALEKSTGGSTGKPLTIYGDARSILPIYEWRAWRWWTKGSGMPFLGQDDARLWRYRGIGVSSIDALRKTSVTFYPQKRAYLDAYSMIDDEINAFMNDLNQMQSPRIMGYTGAVTELAQRIQKGDFKLEVTPQSIAVTSSVLSDNARALIESTFGCSCYDMYASNETSWAAIQYSNISKQLCVLSDVVHLEIVGDEMEVLQDGMRGRTVATTLENHVMPLIRYMIGDYTRMYRKVPECSLPFPLIDPVEGRETDYLIDRDGKKTFGWNASFDSCSTSVHTYQYIQEAPGVVTLLIVKNKQSDAFEKDFAFVQEKFLKPLKGRIDFTIQLVDAIPHDNGKARFIVYKS